MYPNMDIPEAEPWEGQSWEKFEKMRTVLHLFISKYILKQQEVVVPVMIARVLNTQLLS